jgi:hypothetical protein
MAGKLSEKSEAFMRKLWALQRATEAAKNPANLSEQINRKLAAEGFVRRIVADRFSTGGASSGTQWLPLTPRTLAQRRRQGFPPGPVLVRSGTLATAATTGREIADAEKITLEFRDGPAPVYAGGGKARKAKVNTKARAANFFFGMFVGRSGALSDYATALNRKRPFFAQPNEGELAELKKRRDAIIAQMRELIANEGYGPLHALRSI